MTAPAIGDTLPDFKLPATGDQDIALSALRGKSVVLFFYPKAGTPVCLIENTSGAQRAGA